MVLLYGSYASFLLAPQFPDQNAEMPARGNSRHHIGHVLSAASLSTKPGTPGALCESSSLGNQGRFQPMFCAGDVLEHTLEKADPPGAACRFSCREKRICFATSIQGQQGGAWCARLVTRARKTLSCIPWHSAWTAAHLAGLCFIRHPVPLSALQVWGYLRSEKMHQDAFFYALAALFKKTLLCGTGCTGEKREGREGQDPEEEQLVSFHAYTMRIWHVRSIFSCRAEISERTRFLRAGEA